MKLQTASDLLKKYCYTVAVLLVENHIKDAERNTQPNTFEYWKSVLNDLNDSK